jgi:hypothetical protein
VPVTVNVRLPAIVALQETVAVPDPVILVGVIGPQFSPEGIVSVRLTIPPKPLSAVTVMVDGTETPTLAAAGDVVAMLKSWTLKMAVAKCVKLPFTPKIVSV